jgi:hypothetical protein
MSDDIAPVPPLNVAHQITDEDVVKLARAAMEPSRRVEAGGALPSGEGITLDLTHKNIKRLPDEVIDIIKDEIERYVCSVPVTPSRASSPTSPVHLVQIAGLCISTQPNLYHRLNLKTLFTFSTDLPSRIIDWLLFPQDLQSARDCGISMSAATS